MQLRPTGLLQYYEIPEMRSGRKKTNLNAPTHQLYTGLMNGKAIRRLKRCIHILVACSQWKEAKHIKSDETFRFKVNFITLTLPAPQGDVSDSEIKRKSFDPFIKRCKRQFKLVSYVWRAERQKNGNIHFHIMSDVYMHYAAVNRAWNQCIEKLGFVSKFEKMHGHRNPNSTDIHSVRKIRSLANYLAKYMSKMDEKSTPLNGRCWDASMNLKSAKFPSFVLEHDSEELWRKAQSLFPEGQKDMDFCSFISLNEWQFKRIVKGSILEIYEQWLKNIRESN
jgi:hypothetical protein